MQVRFHAVSLWQRDFWQRGLSRVDDDDDGGIGTTQFGGRFGFTL